MGVYIRLSPDRPVAPYLRESSVSRINYGTKVWELFEGWFYPSSVEFWKDSPLKELEGREIRGPLPLDPASRAGAIAQTIEALVSKMDLNDLLSLVVDVKGVWNIGERGMPGHISINISPKWRRMYWDVEVDGETHKEGEDFADVVLNSREMGEAFVRGFIDKITDYRQPHTSLLAIYFFNGPASRKEIFNARSVHYHNPNDYVRDALASYRTELEENQEKALLSGLLPYRNDFLISSLAKERLFEQELKKSLNEAEIIEIPGNSITYIGKNKDSFRKAYDKLKLRAFKKVATNLHPAEQVRGDINRALGGTQRRLDLEPGELGEEESEDSP